MDRKKFEAEVGPLLTQLVSKCEEHGLPMACWVGYDKEGSKSSISRVYSPDWPEPDRDILIQGGMRAQNVDTLVVGVGRYVVEHGFDHNSFSLKNLGIEPRAKDRVKDGPEAKEGGKRRVPIEACLLRGKGGRGR